MENVPDMQSLIAKAQALGQKVDWWNAAMLWSLAFAALAAIAVGIATRMVIARSKQLGDVQDELTLSLRGQVATLESNAANAQKSLAEFQKAASDARAAQQEVEIELAKQREKTANAERATLELKQRMEPRRISGEQQKALAAALAKIPKMPVEIQCVLGDREGCPFAAQIKNVFDSSGWETFGINQITYADKTTTNLITVYVPHGRPYTQKEVPSTVDQIRYAFFSIGLEFYLGFFQGDPSNPIKITIGGKP